MVIQNAFELGTSTLTAEETSTIHSEPSHTSDNTKRFQVKQKAFALNYVSDPVIQYDKNMNIVWANKMVCTLSGMTLNQIIGSHYCQMLFGCTCNAAQCPVQRVFREGRQCTADMKTNDDRAFSITALPFLDTSGQVDTVIAIMKDETNRTVIENLMSGDYTEVASFAGKLSLLTDREHEVMSLVVHGKSNKIVSQELGISCKTVEIHRSRVMAKLEVNSLAELVRLFTMFDFYNQNIPFAVLK